MIDSDFFNAQKTSIDEALSGFDDFKSARLKAIPVVHYRTPAQIYGT